MLRHFGGQLQLDLVPLERTRQMTWMRKSKATMEPREMRLRKLQLVIDEQSPMRIKPHSMIFLVKRKLQEYYVLLNHRQTLRGWHTTRHMFHSEIGAFCVASRGQSSPHKLWRTRRRILCRNSRRITCSFEQWQRAKLRFVETRSGVVISFMWVPEEENPVTF